MTTLLERIGGQDAVTAAVDLFYTKVLEDPQLAPFFADSNMDHQRRRQVAFLTQVLAGKGKMAETYMRNVHRPLVENMGLNETHFGMVAGHLAATLEELGVETDVAADVMADVASLEDSVLNRDVMQVA